jgi:hypothetical protein
VVVSACTDLSKIPTFVSDPDYLYFNEYLAFYIAEYGAFPYPESCCDFCYNVPGGGCFAYELFYDESDPGSLSCNIYYTFEATKPEGPPIPGCPQGLFNPFSPVIYNPVVLRPGPCAS